MARYSYTLSPQAQIRLRQIRDYTLKNYGAAQNTVYLAMLRDKMRIIAQDPVKHGKMRDDIRRGIYSIKADKHVIFYRIRETEVQIIDVLHQAMDPARHI